MIQSLIHSVESRLYPLENNEIFIIAAVLDPRFKMRWSKSWKMEETIAVIDKKSSNLNTQDLYVSLSPQSPPTKKGKTDFFSFLSPSTSKRKRNPSDPATEIDIYQGEDCTEMSDSPLLES